MAEESDRDPPGVITACLGQHPPPFCEAHRGALSVSRKSGGGQEATKHDCNSDYFGNNGPDSFWKLLNSMRNKTECMSLKKEKKQCVE